MVLVLTMSSRNDPTAKSPEDLQAKVQSYKGDAVKIIFLVFAKSL